MRAFVYEEYGPPEVVKPKDVPKPTPKDDELLVRIHATTVASGDWRARSLDVPFGFGFLSRLVFGLFRPRKQVLGTELAGDVESVGESVSRFAVGDQVFAFPGAGMGCHAEYRCVSEAGPVAALPPGLSYDEAAALSFGGTTALDFFRRGKLQAGEEVLIVGASGCVGTAAVQLAKHAGARVTGVCSGANVELVRSLGADDVIDYTREDCLQSGKTYDVIMDTVGTAPYSRSTAALNAGGRLLLVMGSLGDMLRAPWVSLTSSKKIIAGPASERPEDLRHLAQLAEAGAFRPVIGRRYPFEQLVEAHAYVDTGRKQGSVVITLQQPT